MRAIVAEGLGKRYRIGERQAAYGTLRDAIASGVARLTRGTGSGTAPATELWALRDISFEQSSGEVLGIIGPNGAGKTTLLKILSRVTSPTIGRARIRGRVASLLDVGTGFHPELTGRENIFLNGAILGMGRADIERRFDEIVAFAEQERFIDTPVKHYSSGMFMRLAFSVAAHLEPDVLIVDEVLAVGDAAFQRKSLGRMGTAAREGRTVLFVSHNMVAVQDLCDHVIWLEGGRVVAEGEARPIVSRYLLRNASTVTERGWSDTANGRDAAVRLRRAAVRPADGSPADPITMRTRIVLEVEFRNLVDGAHLDLNIQLVTGRGEIAFGSSSGEDVSWRGRPYPRGFFRSQCEIPGDLLIAGRHHVTLSIIRDHQHIVLREEDALVFDVQDDAERRAGWYGENVGVVRPRLAWRTEMLGVPD
jgi:lipopolysaccharide transport system ATP-binding protein